MKSIPTYDVYKMVVDAGLACMEWTLDTWECHLCTYGDHDNDGTERHDDDCPLRPMDDMDEEFLRKQVLGK